VYVTFYLFSTIEGRAAQAGQTTERRRRSELSRPVYMDAAVAQSL